MLVTSYSHKYSEERASNFQTHNNSLEIWMFFCNAESNKDQAQYFIHSDKFDDFLIKQLAPN